MSLVFGRCYNTGQLPELRVKNATLYLHILFWHVFVAFHQKICVFTIFISFYDKVSNLRNKILTNQKRMFGEKLSLELFDAEKIYANITNANACKKMHLAIH